MEPTTTKEQRFPVRGGFTVSWEIAKVAYAAYVRRYHHVPTLQRLAELGGFTTQEMDLYSPGWRETSNAPSPGRGEETIPSELSQLRENLTRLFDNELPKIERRCYTEELQYNYSLMKHQTNNLLSSLKALERKFLSKS